LLVLNPSEGYRELIYCVVQEVTKWMEDPKMQRFERDIGRELVTIRYQIS